MSTAEATISVTESHGVALVELTGGPPQNFFPRARMRELRQIFDVLAADEAVRAVVLWGGADRWFCVGGDFNETSGFSGGDEIDGWIDDITDLYIAALRIPRPVIAAVDGYAVGLGLQLVLCCDFRIAATSATLKMPEFELGIACNYGGFMLNHTVGRDVMQEMLFLAESWPAERALADGLVHEVVPHDGLLDRATGLAAKLAGYPETPVRVTKPHLNAAYVDGLEQVRANAKASHREGFAAGAPQKNMRAVIKS